MGALECPKCCWKIRKIQRRSLGKHARCPNCDTVFVLPTLNECPPEYVVDDPAENDRPEPMLKLAITNVKSVWRDGKLCSVEPGEIPVQVFEVPALDPNKSNQVPDVKQARRDAGE
jgi:hypothetical protein